MRLYRNIKASIFRNPLKTILTFGIVSRGLLFLAYPSSTLFPDSQGYSDLANLLLRFNLVGYDGTRSPGYPLLLLMANNNLYITILIQFIIGIVSMVVLYKILFLLKFSTKSALEITIFCSTFLPVLFYETCILTESLTYFLVLLIFNLFLKDYYKPQSSKYIVLLSFSLAFLILIKPFYIFVPFLLFGLYVLKAKTIRIVFSKTMMLLLCPLLTFLSWSYVNKVNTGYFVPTTFYGFNLAQCCVSFAEKAPAKYEEISKIYVKYREIERKKGNDVAMAIWQAHPELEAKTKLSLPDLSFVLNEFSVATIKANPVDYCMQVVISWNEFWRTSIYWNIKHFSNKKTATVFERIWDIQHYILRLFKILFLLSLVSLIIEFIKNRKFTPEVIFSTVILATSVLQALVVFGTNSRFSYPFETLMMVVVFMQLRKFNYWYKYKNLAD